MKNFGNRMKEYEKMEVGRRFLPLAPICSRIDGKNFSRFTKNLERPYDKRLTTLMQQTTAYLVEETKANIGYTQSDEISLAWYSDDYRHQIFFDRRIQKMVSVLASMTTAYFNSYLSEYVPEKRGTFALFDCRVWQVPTLEEATNVFLWRELDAITNSISMSARHYYSHKELEGKTGNEMRKMLHKKGIDWADYPNFFRRGTFIQRQKIIKKFTGEEIEKLPEKHKARKMPDLEIERAEIRMIEMPEFSKVKNKIEVIFYGAKPIQIES